jgi:hypothetical protein
MSTDPTTKTIAEVRAGDALPEWPVPITTTLIVGGAIASRDYQDVHHDSALAKARGSKDVFMNILTTNGLVGRYVTDWAGPEAVIRSVSIRLGAPNYPGDVMTFTGSVTAVRDDEIEVQLKGANNLGNHVVGSVRVALPAG